LKQLRINELGGHSESSSPGTPSTPTTPINLDSDDTPIFEVGGIVRPMGRKPAKRKAKAQVPDPAVEVLTKELSILGSTKLKESDVFVKYVDVQAAKVQQSKEALAMRDRHLHLKERRYEDWVFESRHF